MKVYFSNYYVDCTEKRLVIGPRDRLLRGRHATLFFETWGSKLWPHITLPGHKDRIWLPAIDLVAVQECFDGLGRELVRMWCNALVRTSPQELADDGWELFVPRDEIMANAIRGSIVRGVCRVNQTLRAKLAAVALDSLDSPLRLPEFVEHARPLLVARVLSDDSEPESRWVSYYSYDLSEGRRAGWYWTSDKWLEPDLVVQRMMSRAAPQIQEALLLLNRWLRIGDEHQIREAFRAGGRLSGGAP